MTSGAVRGRGVRPLNRALLASCWTTAGDAAPQRGDGTSPIDVRERIEAVARTGWAGMGLGHADLVRARDTIGLQALASLLGENGIAEVELEFIRDWWTTGDRRMSSDRVRRDLLEAAVPLGVRAIKAGAKNGGDPIDRDQFLTEFDRLATDAREAGTRIALESTASSDVLPTIKKAVEVVTAVGNPFGGLAVDAWHTSRTGIRHPELVQILPPESVFLVEISDGGEEPAGTVWEDEISHRRLPGAGTFDLPEFIVALHDLGYSGPWGVEILAEEYRKLNVGEGLERAHAAAVRVLDAAELIVVEREA
jgi:sugar phosphate isomerase/epimerase